VIGNSDANGIEGFQLHYFENISSDTNPDPIVGEGVLATFNVRVVGEIVEDAVPLVVDLRSPVGSETGYFVSGGSTSRTS